MIYLADTVALIHHLRNRRKLSNLAETILQAADRGEHTILLSAVTLMEILYLGQANRIPLSLNDLLAAVDGSDNYRIIPLDKHIIATAQTIDDVPELHDRMIVATAVYHQAPILTPDHIIKASQHIKAIW